MNLIIGLQSFVDRYLFFWERNELKALAGMQAPSKTAIVFRAIRAVVLYWVISAVLVLLAFGLRLRFSETWPLSIAGISVALLAFYFASHVNPFELLVNEIETYAAMCLKSNLGHSSNGFNAVAGFIERQKERYAVFDRVVMASHLVLAMLGAGFAVFVEL